MLIVFRWIIGLIISLAIGHFASCKFREFRHKHIEKISNNDEVENVKKKQLPSKTLSATTGLVERSFFTLVIAFDVSGGAVAMIGWLGTKMAVNWNRFDGDNTVARGFSMTALETGMISLFFALIGGIICKW